MTGRFRSHFKDLCLGLALTLVLGLALEMILRSLGHGVPDLDLSRGFDAGALYLIPDPERPGGFRTQFSEGRFEERRIPPRDERTRILLLGGSNTAGLSAVTLAQRLNRDEERFEVINLGRMGYGSARVSILADQALQHLEPDILVVYSGHNEFVERSFRMDLGSSWMDPLLGLASRSALLQTAAEALRADRTAGSGRRPEAWKMEYAKFEGLHYDETLEVIGIYEENLRTICAAAEARGVRVLLSTVIHNLYSAPFESTLPPGLTPESRARFEELHGAAFDAMPAFLAPLLPENEMARVHGPDWREGPDRGGERDSSHGRRPGLGELAGRDSGHPPRPGWNAKIWALWESLEGLYNAPLTGERRSSLEAVEGQLESALAICPDHPLTLFALGLVQERLGRSREEFAQNLHLAARYDRAPRRGNDATNEVVRAVAASFPNVDLLDADRLFAERVPNGLMGWEWMADHCHIVGGAKAVLLGDIARAILAW